MAKIGKYELGKTLGAGYSSKVKFATDTENGECVAIKIVSKKLVEEKGIEKHIRKEIKIMNQLKHKHLIELKEVLQTSSNIYMILELVTGGELFNKILKETKFEEDVARKYFQQTCSGLEYCHQNGVAHRDLKPENILLDKNDNVKLADFGLSALALDEEGEKQMLVTACGSPCYVAPEVLSKKGYDGFKSDVWSLGVILFIMVTGVLPFDDDNLAGLFSKIKKGKVVYPSYLKEDLVDLFQHIFVVNPNDRYTLAEVMKHPWFTVGYKNINEDSFITLEEDDEDFKKIEDVEEKIKKSKHSTKIIPMTAFDLTSLLVLGELNPLMVQTSKNDKFIVQGDLEKLYKEFTKILQKDLKCSVSQKKNILKAQTQYQGQFIVMVIDFQPIVGDLCLCEVKRSKGGIIQFNTLCRTFIEKCKDKILHKSFLNK